MAAPSKPLALVLVAAFALSAAIASAAQANVFMAESYPVHLKGEQVTGEHHAFEFTGSKVECSTANSQPGVSQFRPRKRSDN
jgi:hypothetical protein